MDQKSLKMLIVDDVANNQNKLKKLLIGLVPHLQLIGTVDTLDKGIELIAQEQPDWVFLKIELPSENGFNLLKYIPQPEFELVFMTAHLQYTQAAYRMQGAQYLMYPINPKALGRILDKNSSLSGDKLQKAKPRIALPTSNGFQLVYVDQLLYAEAARSYACFFTLEGEKILVSKPLKSFEPILLQHNFFRINRSSLINLNFLESYSRSDQGKVTLINKQCFSVSEKKRKELLKRLLQ
ncbi:MAG: LytTR family DNA-binding domain-containing protein [Bacteroidota bacterium]